MNYSRMIAGYKSIYNENLQPIMVHGINKFFISTVHRYNYRTGNTIIFLKV